MKHNASTIPALWAALLAFASCADDLDVGFTADVAGQDSHIALRIEVPGMSVATRADMADGQDSQVSSLWVGIFSATDGTMTYAHLLDAEELGAASKENHGSFYTLTGVKARSGPSYVVAVANMSDVNASAYSSAPAASASAAVPPTSWSELLPTSADDAQAKGFTWASFRSIAICRSNVNDISVPNNNLLMSGAYAEGDPHGGNDPAVWEDYCEVHPVWLPATSKDSYQELPGAIHLRRMISQVRFTIRAGDKADGRFVTIRPLEYRVYNVPALSWLYERSEGEASPANAGDAMRVENSHITYPATDALPLKANYRTSSTFQGSQYITSAETAGGGIRYAFDFWMLENKRQALNEIPSGQENYYLREQEYKTDAAGTHNDGKPHCDNTGIYTALCAPGAETMNNCAAYVAIRCRVTYTAAGLESLDDPTTESRTADVTYVVHLGAIYGNNDFNSRRNHRYTYNITVIDVDQVKVEAESDEVGAEPRPGFEGFVTDNANNFIELDAHYAVFNVAFTDGERTTGNSNAFSFRIEAYDLDGQRIIIDESNYTQFDEKYWTWIEFRATPAEDVLAPYRPYGEDGDDETYGRTFRLNEVADLENYPHRGDGTGPEGNKTYYYTVFVNEYAYEDGPDETANTWTKYVNRPNRSAWLNVAAQVSPDNESFYLKSKWALTQRSIQTFYDIQDVSSQMKDFDATGMEHINETFGINLRWTAGNWQYQGKNLDIYNGQFNQWGYLQTRGGAAALDWNTYVDIKSPQKVNAVTRQYYDLAPRTEYLRALVQFPLPLPEGYYDDYDPQGGDQAQVIEAIHACLNRNRDNNGNGKIDIEEVRWYLPSSGELIDMVVGRNSLETPLMDYNANPTMTNAGTGVNGHWGNTRFHYATSNRRKLWAEEGMSTSDFLIKDWANGPNPAAPWQVRCVRTLGTDLSRIELDEVTPAFSVDDENTPTRIYPTNFEARTLREYTAEPLPPHQETSPLNRICYYGFEFKTVALPNDGSGSRAYYYDNGALKDDHDAWCKATNGLCRSTYGEGWRMPNLKEISVIRLAEDGKSPPINIYLSCTYREYGIVATTEDGYQTFSRDDKTGYYFGIKDNNVNCITSGGPYYVRCVRDLKEGEFFE